MADNRAKEKFDAALEALVDGVTGVVNSNAFKRWLDTASKFHKYSFGNQMLIAVQKPSATRVAGFKTWLKLGRTVNKGEKGIMILVPMRSKKTTDADGNEKDGHLFFGTGHVFDVSQTAGEDLPELGYVHTEGDDRADIFDACIAAAEAEGLHVDISDKENGGAYGYLDRAAKRIWVAEKSSVNGRASTLLHELAHWFDPRLTGDDADPFEYHHHRGERETVAEAASYIAATHFGMDVGSESFTYVASWAQDPKVLKARLSEVSKVAGLVIDACEKTMGKVAKEEDEDEG